MQSTAYRVTSPSWARSLVVFGLVLAFVFGSVAPSLAIGGLRGNLSGTVVDAQSHQPVANVQVTAASPSGTFKGSTDAHGFFSLIGIPTDTYTLSFQKEGYVANALPGITVVGDQTTNLGTIAITTNLKTIVKVTARSSSSAYQPSQTQDVTTFSGARIDQALGKAANTNEQQLILSAPGAIETAGGNISIRGSAATEIGYQFDGVDFSAPFFDANPNNGFLNGLGNGFGALQVISGAGDATQGNAGAGVVNIIAPRGVYPAKGLLDFEVGSPFYNHQFSMQYGFATPNGRLSDFIGIASSRDVPKYAPFNADASTIGQYNGVSYEKHDDVLNNLVYRFGKNNDQSLQVLTDFNDFQQYGNYGGYKTKLFYPYDPLSAGQFSFAFPNLPNAPAGTDPQLDYYDSLMTYFPGVPKTNQPPTAPEEVGYNPLHFLKVEYTRALNPSTFLAARYYNWGTIQGSTNYLAGAFFPGPQQVGGSRVGFSGELTKVFSEKHTVTLFGKFENGFPRWDTTSTQLTVFALFLQNFYNQNGNTPLIQDWFLPQTPGQPVSATNPCIGPEPANGFNPTGTASDGCYIYNYLLANGKWTGSLPTIPTTGISYHGSDFQSAAYGIRDQWTPSRKWKFDLGLRFDTIKYKFGKNPFNPSYSNPSDVSPSLITSAFLNPKVIEPRFAASYELDPNDALRFSYGRSVNFFFAQTSGTPADMSLQYLNPIYFAIPPKDSAALPDCGSGWHGPGAGYTPVPGNAYSGSGTGYYFKCNSYAQQVFWAFDQLLDAPDLGGYGPPTYNNWDLEYQHQFTRGALDGWGFKLTGYARRGFNVEENTLLQNGPPNPVTGQTSALVFATKPFGVEKTTGVELMITTPQHATGLSGFLTANYINELTNTPPTAGQETLPILNQFLFNSGTLFHDGFLPPFSARVGITYRTANGWKINPLLAYDNGYPFGVGRSSLGFVNGQLEFIPETNYGPNTPFAGPNGPNNSYNASYYVDPAYPGNITNPNIAASRGYDEPALAGQKLSPAQLRADLDIEYTHGRNTFGVYVYNVFNNYNNGNGPIVNTDWQPVATGVGGPQTGLYAGAYPGSPAYTQGARDEFLLAGAKLPFMPGYNAGTNYQFYYQVRL